MGKKIIIKIVVLIIILAIIPIGWYYWQNNINGNLGGNDLSDSNPSLVVMEYMQYTLGMIPGAKINYEAAKKLLAPDLAKQFDDLTFVPESYCIQDGPTDVRITSKIQDKKMNWTNIMVEAQYGNEWSEMWNFQVVPVEGARWMINKIECL
ncbi:hypothetical protein HY624_00100 [Candidatus Uhrbacteria bacterium]|nr:hypothetical protein [Candidatus Uhrbacteria bacterium]